MLTASDLHATIHASPTTLPNGGHGHWSTAANATLLVLAIHCSAYHQKGCRGEGRAGRSGSSSHGARWDTDLLSRLKSSQRQHLCCSREGMRVTTFINCAIVVELS